MARTIRRPDLSEETLLWESRGSVFVFGVDEAGRGCLAGPVCAAVASWNPCLEPPLEVRDSKKMSEAQREACFDPIREKAFCFGVGFSSREEIDRFNILRANHLAVARALEMALSRMQGIKKESLFAFLSDGNRPLLGGARMFLNSPEYARELPLVKELFEKGFEEKCVVKGDSKVFSIASASILAKVSRDRHMAELHRRFPAYDFLSHKGYSTPRHVELLRHHGPCEEHRRSFSPVSEALGELKNGELFQQR